MNNNIIIIDVRNCDLRNNIPEICTADNVGKVVAVRNVRGKFVRGVIYTNCISLGEYSVECDTPDEVIG